MAAASSAVVVPILSGKRRTSTQGVVDGMGAAPSALPLSESGPLLPAAVETVPVVPPALRETVAAEAPQADPSSVPLVRPRPQRVDVVQTVGYAHAQSSRRGWFGAAAVLLLLGLSGGIGYIMLTGDEPQVSQVEPPESLLQSQNEVLEAEPLVTDSPEQGEVFDIASDEMATTDEVSDGSAGLVAEAGGVVAPTVVAPDATGASQPATPSAAQKREPVVVTPAVVKAPVKPAPEPVAAVVPPVVVKPTPVPPKTVQVPELQPVVPPAAVRVVEPPPAPVAPPPRAPEVVAVTPKSQPEVVTPKPAIPAFSDVELMQLVYKFVFAYEGGDIDRLTGLFTNNATADGSIGRSRIARDYSELFQATDLRKMTVGALIWRPDGDVVHGSGDIEVAVWRRGNDNPTTIKGKINIDIVKADKQLLIRKLTHVVNR